MTASTRWAFGAFFFLYFAYIGLMSPYASLYFAELGFGAIEIAAHHVDVAGDPNFGTFFLGLAL
jgi:hypothetical protein